MGNRFEMLVDADVSLADADRMLALVVDRFRGEGLIEGDLDSDCALSGQGYRPGPALPDLYTMEENESPFWELRTCGVEPEVGRGFNYWAYGPACDGFVCPVCSSHYEAGDEHLQEGFARAIGHWMKGSDSASIGCARCGRAVRLTDWIWRPPLGLSNLRIRFWNWPPLDSSQWRMDIRAVMKHATQHRIVHTYGEI
jgi:hypothetical protein